jgi:peptide/nickel transport system ATP-binding protein
MIACHKGGIENVLTAHGLKKTYQLGERRITAINDVNINVRKGEVVALVGASGSGKSTLAHILVNVLAADTGEVQFAGRPVIEKNATACMGGMQIIFQDPAEAVSHRFKVLDAVREPLDIMLLQDRPHRDRKAIEVMDTMHLPVTPNFLNRTCHTLSGGQRQRLAIARAMITDPVLLVANEITAMLDPSTQAALLRELKGLQHGRGFSMLFITYDIHLARKVSDRVYVLENGRIVKHGASFEVFDHPRAAHTYQLLDAAFDHDRSVGLPINKTKKEKKHATCKI